MDSSAAILPMGYISAFCAISISDNIKKFSFSLPAIPNKPCIFSQSETYFYYNIFYRAMQGDFFFSVIRCISTSFFAIFSLFSEVTHI